MLEDDDARILSQPPVQLTMTHVERDDARGAALQQDICEATGRRADIEAFAAGDGDLKSLERMRELQATAADVRVIRGHERDICGVVHGGARLGHRPPVYGHLPGDHQRPSPFTRRRQLAIEQ
jgi:hypothetical protein